MSQRLTTRIDNGETALYCGIHNRQNVGMLPIEFTNDAIYPEAVRGLIDILEKLAAYEDTGLSPGEVREYARARDEGRVVVLPVKLGDRLWRINTSLSKCGTPYKFIVSVKLNRNNLYRICFEGEWMRCVFATRAEAEAALNP